MEDVSFEFADEETRAAMLKVLAGVKNMSLGQKCKLAKEHGLLEGLNHQQRRDVMRRLKKAGWRLDI